MDRGQEEALVRIAGDDCLAGVATFEDRLARGEAETALRLLLMTTAALRREDGTDLVLEELIAALDLVWTISTGFGPANEDASQTASILIHSVRCAICSSFSLGPRGGIFKSPVCFTA